MAAAEAILGEAFAYARVDLIPSAQGPMLMELELVEPSLFLIHCPQAAEAFAALLDAAWKTAPESAALEELRQCRKRSESHGPTRTHTETHENTDNPLFFFSCPCVSVWVCGLFFLLPRRSPG